MKKTLLLLLVMLAILISVEGIVAENEQGNNNNTSIEKELELYRNEINKVRNQDILEIIKGNKKRHKGKHEEERKVRVDNEKIVHEIQISEKVKDELDIRSDDILQIEEKQKVTAVPNISSVKIEINSNYYNYYDSATSLLNISSSILVKATDASCVKGYYTSDGVYFYDITTVYTPTYVNDLGDYYYIFSLKDYLFIYPTEYDYYSFYFKAYDICDDENYETHYYYLAQNGYYINYQIDFDKPTVNSFTINGNDINNVSEVSGNLSVNVNAYDYWAGIKKIRLSIGNYAGLVYNTAYVYSNPEANKDAIFNIDTMQIVNSNFKYPDGDYIFNAHVYDAVANNFSYFQTPVYIKIANPPSTPKNLVATDTQIGREIKMTWSSNNEYYEPDIWYYNLYCSKSTGIDPKNSSTYDRHVEAICVDDFGAGLQEYYIQGTDSYFYNYIIDGEKFYFVITATDNSFNESSPSNEVEVIPTLKSPNIYLINTEEGGEVQITINQEVSDVGNYYSGADRWKIYYGKSPLYNTNSIETIDTQITINALDNNSNYSFAAKAIADINGYESIYSSVKTITPTLGSPEITSLVDTMEGGEIYVTWVSKKNIDGLSIYISENPGIDISNSQTYDDKIVLDSSEDNKLLENLTNGRTYYIVVSNFKTNPTNGQYTETPSAGKSIIPTIAPPAISGIEDLRTGNSLKVVWNKRKNAAGYQLYFSETQDGLSDSSPIDVGLTTEYILSGLCTDINYYIGVKAYDDSGYESPDISIIQGIPTLLYLIDIAIKNTNAGDSLKLFWKLENQIENIVRFNIYRGVSEDHLMAATNEIAQVQYIEDQDTYAFEDINLINGQRYFYTLGIVTSTVNCGEYTSSKSDEIVSENPFPSPPLNFSATNYGDGNTVFLSWDKPDRTDISKFVIYEGNSTDLDKINYIMKYEILYMAPTEIFSKGLITNKEYFFRICSVDTEMQEGPLSEMVSIITADSSIPLVPSGFTAVEGDSYVDLRWNYTNEDDIAGYIIYGKEGPNPGNNTLNFWENNATLIDNTIEKNKIYYRAENLINGVEYCFALFSRDTSMNYSDGVCRTATPEIQIRPCPPLGLMANGNDGYIELEWMSNHVNDGVDHYNVYRSQEDPELSEFAGWGDPVNVNPVKVNSFTDNNVVNGKSYYYCVSAVDVDRPADNQESEYSLHYGVVPNLSASVIYSVLVPSDIDQYQDNSHINEIKTIDPYFIDPTVPDEDRYALIRFYTNRDVEFVILNIYKEDTSEIVYSKKIANPHDVFSDNEKNILTWNGRHLEGYFCSQGNYTVELFSKEKQSQVLRSLSRNPIEDTLETWIGKIKMLGPDELVLSSDRNGVMVSEREPTLISADFQKKIFGTHVDATADVEFRIISGDAYAKFIDDEVVYTSDGHAEIKLYGTASGVVSIKARSGKLEDTISLQVYKFDISVKDIYGGVVSEDEETNPGAFIHYNTDNDNKKRIGLDSYPDYKKKVLNVQGEDDLKQIEIIIDPIPNKGSINLKRSRGILYYWKHKEKGDTNKLLLDLATYGNEKNWDLSNENQRNDFDNVHESIWIEGFDDGIATNILEYKDVNGNIVCKDSILFTSTAAICGYQPNFIQSGQNYIFVGDLVKSEFPKIVHCEWSILDPRNNKYNCIAWSVNISDKWVWGPFEDNQPLEQEVGGVTHFNLDKFGTTTRNGFGNDKLDEDDFDALYEHYGYEETSDSAEADIILYKSDDAKEPVRNPEGFTHAARKRACDHHFGMMFESKLGNAWKIEHVQDHLNDKSNLEKSHYGQPYKYYKKSN
ncbi:fibronectin type III domain-containing protein [bacterium]|nr:fibronectin type III domain-containing protein [bacterium]